MQSRTLQSMLLQSILFLKNAQEMTIRRGFNRTFIAGFVCSNLASIRVRLVAVATTLWIASAFGMAGEKKE